MKLFNTAISILISFVTFTTSAQIITINDITPAKHQETLTAIDDERVAFFLNQFINDLKKYDQDQILTHMWKEHYGGQIPYYYDEGYGYSGSLHIDTINKYYLRNSLSAPSMALREYSQDFTPAFDLPDWTAIQEVYCTKSEYISINYDPMDGGYWVIQFAIITDNKKYYVGQIYCMWHKGKEKVRAFSAAG